MTPQLAPASGHCPVCGSTLGEGRVVACARCETAHHHDCIEYGGGCAVYACGSRAYRKPDARLAFVERPAPAQTALAKPIQMTALVETLERPVLRVSARSANRTAFIAQAITVGTFGTAAVLLLASQPAKWAGTRLLFGALAELLSIGFGSILGLILVLCALVAVSLRVGWDALLFGTGLLLHNADASEYELDRENRRLVRRPRFLGLPGPARAWNACDVRGVRLIADPVTHRVRLELVLDGAPVVLADDTNTYPSGYHWSELARLGQRLAGELEVPLEYLVPWKVESKLPARGPA